MNLNEQERLAKLLKKYLAGKATPEEESYITEWYNQLNFEQSSSFNKDEDMENQKLNNWIELNSRIQKTSYRGVRNKFKSTQKKRRKALAWVGAMLVFFCIAYQWYTVSYLTDLSKSSLAYVSQQNKTTSTLRVTLSDGTLVWLEPLAEIKYPKRFKGASRNIMLNGKAFLDVARDPQHPFLVKGEAVDVQVLGTSFEVDFNSKKQEASVLVRSGEVAVTPTKQSLPGFFNFLEPTKEKTYLLPNESSRLNTKSKNLLKSKLAADYWTKQIIKSQLIFKETPLAEIITKLEDQHKVAIRMQNPQLKSCTLTAYFYDQPLEVKLEMICKSIGANYKADHDKFIIFGNGCSL
ncbi:FecR family protein [Adhaeribacter radiodurans]|uniref:FecR domain-containing protein n=1 Tax=Adhaeribacter radiodurans TaxID=2745197 RepID=A0A7L7L633_9BACT|nr:FecR domain-containing protein [Adhaeribacter radiodurans]QMU28250.1 FecR domain-containing protein [Adhaeribacter radiodurans]